MASTVFVQANSNVGSGLHVTTWTISLTNPSVSGNWIFLSFFSTRSSSAAFSISVSSNISVAFPAIQSGPLPVGSTKIQTTWAALLTASGTVTVTITIAGGTFFSGVAAALAEYTTDPISTAAGLVSFQGWSGPNLGGTPLIDASLIGGVNPLTDSVQNVSWQPSTAYSNTGIGQVKANTPDLQSVFVAGTSGLTQPVWTGGLTPDLTPLIWQDTGTPATDGLMNLLGICVSGGFFEFPALSGSGGFTLRTMANNASTGIQLLEKNTNFVDAETITLTKSVNTYAVAFSLVPMSSSAPSSGGGMGPILLPQNFPVIYLPGCYPEPKCKFIRMVFDRD